MPAKKTLQACTCALWVSGRRNVHGRIRSCSPDVPSGGLTCKCMCAQHYHLRWEAHMNSQKLEAQVRAKLQASIDKLEKKQSTLKDYSWLSAVRASFSVRQAPGFLAFHQYYICRAPLLQTLHKRLRSGYH